MSEIVSDNALERMVEDKNEDARRIRKKPFNLFGKFPKFYPTMCWNEWLKTRTKMQFAISIKSMMRLFSAHTLSLLKWTV